MADNALVEFSAGAGAQRAAAVLLGLGHEVAAQIFKTLDEGRPFGFRQGKTSAKIHKRLLFNAFVVPYGFDQAISVIGFALGFGARLRSANIHKPQGRLKKTRSQ